LQQRQQQLLLLLLLLLLLPHYSNACAVLGSEVTPSVPRMDLLWWLSG